MSLTPNFGFNIPVGTDTVNLLTQCYPNFTSLDTILQAIKESGVSTATATKSGTTHQIVRTVADCNVFRFVATANYSSGDIFTVDGLPVTATAVNGTSLPAGAFVINQSVLCILNGSVLTVAVAGAGDAQNIGYDNAGSGLTASNVQDAIDEVVADIPTGFAATAITYDNTVSGLTATNAQDAIDELASGSGGSDHGIYELWKNSDVTTSFNAGDVVLSDFDSTKIDAIIIVVEQTSSERFGGQWFEFDKDVLNIVGSFSLRIMEGMSSAGKLVQADRPVSFNLTGTTLTISFSACTETTYNTYGAAGTAATNNGRCIPVRILGLVHND